MSARLEFLITKGETRKAQSLLVEVFPRYWKDESTSLPLSVYRTIYYLDLASDYVGDTRHLIENMGQHLEGVVNQLVRQRGLRVKQELGTKIQILREEIGENLGSEIRDFNNLIHNVAKHPDDDSLLPARFNVRRFSTHETLLSLMITRHFSIQLFGVLERNGITVPQAWPQFRTDWISWDREGRVSPPVLPRAERVRVRNDCGNTEEEDVTS